MVIEKEEDFIEKYKNFDPGSARKDDVALMASKALEMGKEFYNNIRIEDNYIKAFKWFYFSAKQGNMEAQFHLGNLYALGHGTTQSNTDAHMWYTKSAIQGYKKALIRIHNLYEQDKIMYCRSKLDSNEEAIKKPPQFSNQIEISAVKYYRELNEQRFEDHKPTFNSSINYYTEQFKKHKSSNQKDADAQLNLAFLFQHGYGVKVYTMRAIELYKIAAEQGHKDAQYNVAYMYQTTPDIKFNYRYALRWYRASATNGNIAAQNNLAYFYEKGLATEIDWEGALYWYTKAANAGNSNAQLTLGKFYRKGEVVKQNYSEAAKWYKLAANQGNNAAQNCLNQLHQSGKVTASFDINAKPNYATELASKLSFRSQLQKDISELTGFPRFNQLKTLGMHALMNDGNAMYDIGLKYYEGVELPLDKDTGYQWVKVAAKAGLQEAVLKFSEMHKEKNIIPQDNHTSSAWTTKQTRKKNDKTQHHLGFLYKEVFGSQKDYLEPSKWITKSGDRKNRNSHYQLDTLKYYDKDVNEEKKTVSKRFDKSTLYGNPKALYIRAKIYEFGYYGEINEQKAIMLYENAARLGSKVAQFNLGRIYEEGKLIQQNLSRAHEYYISAADSNVSFYQYQLAIKYINEVFGDPDYTKAFELFKKAADNNNSSAVLIFQTPAKRIPHIRKYSNIINMFILASKRGIEGIDYNIGYAYEHGIDRRTVESADDYPLESHNLSEKVFYKDYENALKYYSLAASKNDSRAQYRLGYMYEEGKGVEKNLHKALDHYSQAYKNRNGDATSSLALMHLNGNGVSQDLVKAYYLFTEASNMGHKESHNLLAPLNNSEKLMMLEKVAALGHVAIQYQLGLFYEGRDDLKSLKWFTLAAYGGITDACYRLGLLYEEGIGVHSDISKAITFYEKAIENDDENAMYRLAEIYIQGKNIKCDYLKAYDLYSRAAKLGHGEAFKLLNAISDSTLNSNEEKQKNALSILSREQSKPLLMFRFVAKNGNTDIQFRLGLLYERGRDDQNYQEAFKWYKMAANKDKLEATYRLGLLYEKGLGITQNYNMAIQLYNRAKDQGIHDAFYRLGRMFHYGYGVDASKTKAIHLYKEAAELGNNRAQRILGELYETGYLGQRDTLRALKWYTKAYLSDDISIVPELNRFYDCEPYERFFYKKLFNILLKLEKSPKPDNQAFYEKYGTLHYKIGFMYLNGIGTKKSKADALKQFLKSYYDYSYKNAEPFITLKYEKSKFSSKKAYTEMLETFYAIRNEIPPSHQLKLGMLHYNGYKIYNTDKNKSKNADIIVIAPADRSIALEYFKLASKTRHNTLHQRGISYLEGNTVQQDNKQAFEWFHKAAEIGDPFDCYNKGITCYNEKKYEVALIYLREAAEKNHRLAQSQLVKMFLQGDSVEKNVGEAIKLIEQSTQIMSPDECYEQGMEFYKGIGVEKNYSISLIYFKKAAEKKNVLALAQLSKMFLQGDGVEENLDEALQWVTKHTKEISPKECYELGIKYLEGVRVDKNYKIARIYLEKAAENGHPEGQYQLGMLYFEGNGVEKNIDEAAKWMEQSINEMDPEKCYKLGNSLYQHGKDIEKNRKDASLYYQRALMWFEKAAEKEHRESQLKTGVMYLQGLGVESNLTESTKWLELYSKEMTSYQYYERGMNFFVGDKYGKSYETSIFFLKKASELENSSAQAQLGDMYLRGFGTRPDYEKAIKMYELSTNEMSDYYCYERALKFYIGNGVTQSYKISFLYMKKAAEKGHNEAKSKVGEMYIQGRGVELDKNKAINWFKLYAERMDGYACYERGTTYYDGDGVEKNHEIALIYLTFAAEKEYSESYAKLGDMYLQGSGTDKDFDKAISYFELYTKEMNSDKLYDFGERYYRASDNTLNRKVSLIYFKKAAKEDQGLAQARLAEMYLLGLEVEKNVDKAMELFKASTRNMDKYDMFDLGERFFYGNEVEENYEVAAIYFETAAEEDNDQAQAKLGDMYYYGYGVEKNYTKAIEWHERSLEGIDPSDCYDLGSKYYSDLDDPNYHIAFVYYKQAAEGGYDVAQNALGDMYLNGYGVEKNITEALKWIKNAAKSSPSTYSYKLGEMYHASQGIQDFPKALEAYKKAKGSKKSYALRGIGVLYEYGDGVDQDYQKAFDYYKQAAEARNKGAYYNLGLMYYNGRGTSQNYEEAFKWFTEITKGSPKNDDAYVFVQPCDKHANDTSTFEKREYSLQKEDFIYGKAHYYLGTMYKEGQGTQKNENEAKKHFEVSIQN